MDEKKKLGFFDLLSIGVGCTLGAGIFAMLGVGIQHAGRAIPFALILAMVIVTLQNIRSYALTSVFVLPGGLYDQAALLLPLSFTGSRAITMIISNLSISVPSIAISSYLAQLFPALEPYQRICSVVFVTVFFAISIPGSKFLSFFQNIMAVMMYIALALLVVFGLLHRDPAVAADPLFPEGATGFLTATALMTYTCNGAMATINMTSDAKDPKKNIPKAIIWSCVVAGGIYALLGLAATVALPYDQIAGKNLGYIAQQIMPTGFYLFFLVGGAIFALGTTLLGNIASVKWPIFSLARDGWLPPVFSKQLKNGCPWVIMLMMYLISTVPIICGFSLDSIVSTILVANAVINIGGNILNWNLPKQFPKAWAENSWHMTEGVWHLLMILSDIACVMVLFYSLSSKSLPAILANIAMCVFVFAFGYFRAKSGKVHIQAREIYSE